MDEIDEVNVEHVNATLTELKTDLKSCVVAIKQLIDLYGNQMTSQVRTDWENTIS